MHLHGFKLDFVACDMRHFVYLLCGIQVVPLPVNLQGCSAGLVGV
jgi:hypothetical protein